jgi:chromosome segregation ATPase
LEDGRRQDAKRLTDVQGEQAALRKRMDEMRSQSDIAGTSLKKLDTRLNEIEAAEREKRTTQAKFIEEQSLVQAERDRLWREWQSRFGLIEKQGVELEATLQTLDTTQRTVSRTQQTVEELAQKVERRITEMTEVQRLADERFRQEWVTFKADDQKRWTNYTLTQEEQQGEGSRRYEKLNDRLIALEDTIQEFQDTLQIMNELNGKLLQSLLASMHEWVDTYERSLGRSQT